MILRHSVYLFERSCERDMGQQTCGPTCALAQIRPHFYVRFVESLLAITCNFMIA